MKGHPSVLLVSDDQYEKVFLRAFGQALNLEFAPTVAAAVQKLQNFRAGLVISDRELPDGTWREVLMALSGLTPPPLLIVACPHADDRLWVEVLNLGGYDVLAKPFVTAELVRSVHLAWTNWQQALRDAEAG